MKIAERQPSFLLAPIMESSIQKLAQELLSLTPLDGANAVIKGYTDRLVPGTKNPEQMAQRNAESAVWRVWEALAGGGPFQRQRSDSNECLHVMEVIRLIAFPEIRKHAVA